MASQIVARCCRSERIRYALVAMCDVEARRSNCLDCRTTLFILMSAQRSARGALCEKLRDLANLPDRVQIV